MGMLTAMYSGVAGLNTHGKALSSVADNIANVSTYGYKATRTNFADIMVHSLTVGGTVVSQVGSGSRVTNIQNLLTQGSFENTEIPTDLAINGSGFFQVSRDGLMYYTRAGQFLLDTEGFLITPTGERLQGYNVDEDGNLQQVLEDLQIVAYQADANATGTVELSINLDAEDENTHHPSAAVVPEDETTWNYMTPTRVYDSLGVAHDLATFYQRIDVADYPGALPIDPDDPTRTVTGIWKATVYESVDGEYTAAEIDGLNTFYLHFDTDGHLVAATTGMEGFGDEYVYQNAVVTNPTDAVSSNGGEVLYFQGATTRQELRTTSEITFDNAALSGNLDIGGVIIDLTAIDPGTNVAADNANAVADAINSVAGRDFYAVTNGATVTLYGVSGGSSFDIDDTGTTGILAGGIVEDTALEDAATPNRSLTHLINNGREANAAVFINTANLNATEALHITIGANTYDFTYNGVGDWGESAGGTTGHATLEAAINAAGIGLTATANGTSGVFIETSATSALYLGGGNGITVTSDDATAFVQASGANFQNGLDSTLGHNNDGHDIQASAVAQSAGYALQISRNHTNPDSTDTITADFTGLSNTLGQSENLNFESANQTVYAADEVVSEGPANFNGEIILDFGWMSATGAGEPQYITFDYTPTDSSISATTQSAGNSETYYLYQDGYTRGSLQSLDINTDGIISGQFSNGTLLVLGQVTLVSFASPEALKREGDNLWSETINSGQAIVNEPGQGGLGTLESGALEQSNVDLANEFVKMIQYQRAFQANSKIITTTDQMLSELINLKR